MEGIDSRLKMIVWEITWIVYVVEQGPYSHSNTYNAPTVSCIMCVCI